MKITIERSRRSVRATAFAGSGSRVTIAHAADHAPCGTPDISPHRRQQLRPGRDSSVADRDDVVKFLAEIHVQMFTRLMGNVYADLGHHL